MKFSVVVVVVALTRRVDALRRQDLDAKDNMNASDFWGEEKKSKPVKARREVLSRARASSSDQRHCAVLCCELSDRRASLGRRLAVWRRRVGGATLTRGGQRPARAEKPPRIITGLVRRPAARRRGPT